MPTMPETPRNLPAPNQLGVLAATVLLCYALTHLASRPGLTLAIQLPGFYFAYSLTMGTAMTLMAAGLTASGMDWLLRGHPGLRGRRTAQHWMLPTLTALIIGIVLDILPDGPAWWTGLVIGAVILVAVLIAEYITVDPGAPLYALASAGLTASVVHTLPALCHLAAPGRGAAVPRGAGRANGRRPRLFAHLASPPG